MKRIIGSIGIIVFLLTGCGPMTTETMSCTYESTTGLLSSRTTYNVDYQGNDIKKVRITYKYHNDDNQISTTDETDNNQTDGVGTGTDGTTDDNSVDDDGIIDGVVGSAIDTIINGVTTTILDISGLRDRHATVQNTYANMNGFSVQNTTDVTDNDYTVTYVIDYDNISDEDLNSLNLVRDINTLRSNYTNQGFTCN